MISYENSKTDKNLVDQKYINELLPRVLEKLEKLKGEGEKYETYKKKQLKNFDNETITKYFEDQQEEINRTIHWLQDAQKNNWDSEEYIQKMIVYNKFKQYKEDDSLVNGLKAFD